MKNCKKDKGYITIEACVSVIFFLILMFLISGMFTLFMAQNAISHALLETTGSLSLDTYSTSKLKDYDKATAAKLTSEFITKLFGNSNDNPYFVSDFAWYDDPNELEKSGNADAVKEAVKLRFIGFLTGGNEEEADNLLKSLNVVDGLEGLDFSKSRVEKGDLYIEVHYKLKYYLRIWGLNDIDVEQVTRSKLWL